jgi:N-acetylgalactosamine-N,N'-diacetylbacillosaminyl-diphospho-undecaprenol 4-alpha-N-acetylgalactosaminyltransferase
MKITILINSLAGGGAERVVSHLLTYFDNKGVKIHLVLMENIILYNIPSEIQIDFLGKNKGTESNIKKFLKLPILAYRYAKILNKNQTDISISFLTRPNFINLGSKFFCEKATRIISERSNPGVHNSLKTIRGRLNSIIIKNTYHLSDGVIANSNGNSLDLQNNFFVPATSIKTINNPIDLGKVEKTSAILNFFDKDYFNFITVGRLNKGKNHKLLLSALYTIQNKRIRLYIFGNGPEQDFLNNLIIDFKLQEQVFLMGFSKDIYSYLKSADSFVFGSNHEGFPNVILEAMACGLPIVTTDCPYGPDEIMKNDRSITLNKIVITDFGLLVAVNSINDMALAMQKMVDDQIYQAKCKENVLSRANDFDVDIIMEEYYKYVKDLFKIENN